jgi:hypothetical protein
MQESKKTKIIKRALREHYDVELDFDRMSLKNARNMLFQVRGLLKESRNSKSVHSSHQDQTYLKMVMLEQALTSRVVELTKDSRIVFENEQVQKSQVLLAAQELIDSVQKMREQVSKMKVEEVSAVAQGASNEYGTEKGRQFSGSASAALEQLERALDGAKAGLETAQSALTGDGMGDMGAAPDMGDMGGDMGGMGAMPPPMPGAEPEMGPPEGEPEPEAEEMGGAGRERR